GGDTERQEARRDRRPHRSPQWHAVGLRQAARHGRRHPARFRAARWPSGAGLRRPRDADGIDGRSGQGVPVTGGARTTRSTIRRLQVCGCLMIVLGAGGFSAWSATTRIVGAVIAKGTLVVESNAKKVQHLTGGIVGEILVRNGSSVEAGQPLLRL